LGIGRRETDPGILLNRLCSHQAIERHLQSVAPKIAIKIAETKALALSKPGDQPMHEFSWHLAVQPDPDDPLTHLATLGLLAIQHGDLAAFGGVVTRFLEVLELADNAKLPKTDADDYRIRAEIRSQMSPMSDEQRPRWIGLVEAALSRFHGKETAIVFERQPDGKDTIHLNQSEKDHVEGFMMNAGSREVNYADFTFLKDLELHGGKGILMQGPVVPLSFSSDKAKLPKAEPS
jgi:hypothetical protein